jgi:hypothetical protein
LFFAAEKEGKYINIWHKRCQNSSFEYKSYPNYEEKKVWFGSIQLIFKKLFKLN